MTYHDEDHDKTDGWTKTILYVGAGITVAWCLTLAWYVLKGINYTIKIIIS